MCFLSLSLIKCFRIHVPFFVVVFFFFFFFFFQAEDGIRDGRVTRVQTCALPILIHGDLGGNVLFAPGQPPAVIDFSPYWRPAGLALAVAAVDALTWSGADPAILDQLADQPDLDQLLARAHVGRLVTEIVSRRDNPEPYTGLETVTRTGEPVTALVLERLAAGRVV